MPETWMTAPIIKRPGPVQKQGYTGAPSRTLGEIEGEVKHSTEGSLQAAFGELDKLTRQASWHFTIDFDGTIYQHYPLEAICWHAGGPGDRRQDTSLIGNLTLVGVEHVDRIAGMEIPGLTGAQVNATAWLSAEIRIDCPTYASNPPILRKNLYEHNWLSATACPSGLIPWNLVIETIKKLEVDMTLTSEEHQWLEEAKNASRNVDVETDPMIQQWPQLVSDVAEIKAALAGTGSGGALNLSPADLGAIEQILRELLNQTKLEVP